MSDHTSQVEADVAAPVSGDTAPSDAVDTGEQEEHEQQEPRTFTQAELDAIVAKEKAKERRRAERDYAEKANAPKPMVQPKPDQFATPAEYIEAAANFKAEQIVAEKEAKREQSSVLDSYSEREEAAREKYTDYEDVALLDTEKGGPAISKSMAEVILESKVGPEIAYYLGKNVEESKRIWAMKPLAQAAALGRIEASLTTKPVAKAPSSAPDPIKPLGGSRASSPAYSPSDPRSMEMPVSDWIAARNKQLRNKK